MSAKKKKYPYYAKWNFFLLIIGLGWITPITKHWDKFLFWEKGTAYPVRMSSSYGLMHWYYIYKRNGRDYTVSFDGGPAYYVTYENVEGSNEEVYYAKEPPFVTLKVYVDPADDGSSFYLDLETMYDNEHLFFPVALQIGMVAFFMAVRYK